MRAKSARHSVNPGAITVANAAGQHRIEETLRFITPMFGGGVRLNARSPHQKEADTVTPVRGASLRGQLRAWWRRACAADLDLGTMRAREKVLWGWASTQKEPAKGLVSVSVSAGKLKSEPVQVYRTDDRGRAVAVDGAGSALAYGAFPLQPAQSAQGQPAGTLTRWFEDFSVTLELHPLEASSTYGNAAANAWAKVSDGRLSEVLWEEVERAWLAFVTFGGLGGRTRRGFGAVRVVGGGAKTLAEVTQRLGWEHRVARLQAPQTNPEQAQKSALAKLQGFRQGKELGRNQPGPGSRSPAGRSRWPEPDELRRLTGQSDPTHRDPITLVRKFPRAVFGMPIIFHFQSRTDPKDQSLQPADRERLASPVVIRPVVDPDRTVHGVALRLPGERALAEVLSNLQLRGRREKLSGLLTAAEQSELRPLRANSQTPIAALDGVLVPFFTYFQS